MAHVLDTSDPSSENSIESTSDEIATPAVYQLKVEYKYGKPKVWRKIQVPSNYTFKNLHLAILDCMHIGLCSCGHLHRFDIVRKRISARERYEKFLKLEAELEAEGDKEKLMDLRINYGVDEENEDDKVKDSEIVSDRFKTPGDIKINYTFDFGDSSEFIIVLDKVLQPLPNVEYPRIVGGRCKCVPDHPGNLGKRRWQEFEENQKIFNYKDVTFPRSKKVIILGK